MAPKEAGMRLGGSSGPKAPVSAESLWAHLMATLTRHCLTPSQQKGSHRVMLHFFSLIGAFRLKLPTHLRETLHSSLNLYRWEINNPLLLALL